MCKQNMTNTSTKLKCWSHACDSSPYGLLFFPFLWIFTSVVITISASELHSSDSCVKWIPFLRFVFFFLVLNSFIALVRAKKESKDASHICTTISMLLTKHLRWLLLLSLFNLTFSIQLMWYNELCEMDGNGHWTHCEECYTFRIIFLQLIQVCVACTLFLTLDVFNAQSEWNKSKIWSMNESYSIWKMIMKNMRLSRATAEIFGHQMFNRKRWR